MKTILKNIRFVILIIGLLSISTSCEKLKKWMNPDLDPYSETKDEYETLIGFSMNGTKFIQASAQKFPKVSVAMWNIVEINGEKQIIASTKLTYNSGSFSVGCEDIWLFFPYHDIEIGKYYSTMAYPSYVSLHSFRSFILDGKEFPGYIVRPISVSVIFEKKGKTIQGKFTAEGDAIELADGETVNIKLTDGVFSFSERCRNGYSFDTWLSGIEKAKADEEWFRSRTN